MYFFFNFRSTEAEPPVFWHARCFIPELHPQRKLKYYKSIIHSCWCFLGGILFSCGISTHTVFHFSNFSLFLTCQEAPWLCGSHMLSSILACSLPSSVLPLSNSLLMPVSGSRKALKRLHGTVSCSDLCALTLFHTWTHAGSLHDHMTHKSANPDKLWTHRWSRGQGVYLWAIAT